MSHESLAKARPRAGGAFYDEPGVFHRYTTHRGTPTNPNDLVEEPALLDLLGSVMDKRVLDLGCGAGTFGQSLLQAGCHSYVGIDASLNMVTTAQQVLDGTAGQVHHQSIEQFSAESATYDLVVSRLAFHYVDQLAPVFQQVRKALTSGGRFVFSVEHPVITSCARGWDSRQPRSDWLVDDYFVTGRRESDWLGARVVKYHRTVEDYLSLVQEAGLCFTRLSEARPRPERFHSEADFHRRSRIPLFLIVAATVPQ